MSHKKEAAPGCDGNGLDDARDCWTAQSSYRLERHREQGQISFDQQPNRAPHTGPFLLPKFEYLPPNAIGAEAVDRKGKSGKKEASTKRPSSYVTVPSCNSLGLSVAETRRLSRFGEHIDRRYLRSGDHVALLLVIAASHLDDKTLLDVRRDVQRVVGKVQGRAGMEKPMWCEVRESEGGTHFNVILVLPADSVEVIDVETKSDGREVWRVSSPLDGCLMGRRGDVGMGKEIAQPDRFRQHNRAPENGKRRELFDLQMIQPGEMGNVVGYLSKEMTPWAQRAMNYALPRRPGAHKLTVGGDRVRMCTAVKEALERAELIKPHRKAYAKASLTRRCQPSCVTKRHSCVTDRHIASPIVTSTETIEQGDGRERRELPWIGDEGNGGSEVAEQVRHGKPLKGGNLIWQSRQNTVRVERVETSRRAKSTRSPRARITWRASALTITIPSKRRDRGGVSAMIEQGHEVAGRRQSERRQPRGHPGKVRRRACVLRSSCRRHANRPAARLRLSWNP